MLPFLNAAHFLDHFFLLIFPTAVLVLHGVWGLTYGEALALGTPAFAVFALATLPVGWLGDRFDRARLMTVFFIGIGAASILAGLAPSPLLLSAALGLLGLFAAIYHPIATALVVACSGNSGRALGINGVFGNLGVAGAPLITGALAATLGWRAAFVLPGIVAVLIGLAFAFGPGSRPVVLPGASARARPRPGRHAQVRVLLVVAIGALFGGVVFNGLTVALPRILEERLVGLAGEVGWVGFYASLVFTAASLAQVVVGRLLDQAGARVVLLVCALGQSLLLALAAGLGGLPLLLLTVPLMLFVFGKIPINAWLVGHYAADEWRSRIYGVQYTLSLGVSAAVVPMIAVLHTWSGGFALFFWVLATAAAVIAGAALLLPGGDAPAPERVAAGAGD